MFTSMMCVTLLLLSVVTVAILVSNDESLMVYLEREYIYINEWDHQCGGCLVEHLIQSNIDVRIEYAHYVLSEGRV